MEKKGYANYTEKPTPVWLLSGCSDHYKGPGAPL